MPVVDEVLAANEQYASAFGDRSELFQRSPRLTFEGITRFPWSYRRKAQKVRAQYWESQNENDH